MFFFRFTGAFTGVLLLLQVSAATVKSIELQLVRVETVKHPDSGKIAREATEIQNIQIGDGDVTRNLVIPMYMVRLSALCLSCVPSCPRVHIQCVAPFSPRALLRWCPDLSSSFHLPHDDHRAVQGRVRSELDRRVWRRLHGH